MPYQTGSLGKHEFVHRFCCAKIVILGLPQGNASSQQQLETYQKSATLTQPRNFLLPSEENMYSLSKTQTRLNLSQLMLEVFFFLQVGCRW